MIAIVDYKASNIMSVKNALDELGYEYIISSKKEDFRKAKKIIFPGVGAMPNTVKLLKEGGLWDLLNQYVIDLELPYLGICLGMQSMVSESFEFNLKTKTFDWIKGQTKILENKNNQITIPNMGWLNIKIKLNHKIFEGLKKEAAFYFCHSYAVKNCDKILAIADHQNEFPSVIGHNNIIGVQFHPEKSGLSGLKIIENFCEWNPQ